MNKQGKNGIEWTSIRLPDGTVMPGYTWNPVGGCWHGCRWHMPDGTTAICYAEAVAEGVARTAYPQGFDHHYWHPSRLDEPVRHQQPAGIFLDSMSDLMGHWVPHTEVEQVLDVCRRTPQHIYFLLTKNAPRLQKFEFPDNVWVGVSSPPDVMFNRPLTTPQKLNMLQRSLIMLSQVKAAVRWVSFEPLSWDVSDVVTSAGFRLDWSVIGAASNGRLLYPPAAEHVQRLLAVLDGMGTKVFFKGNMRSLDGQCGWRGDFPPVRKV